MKKLLSLIALTFAVSAPAQVRYGTFAYAPTSADSFLGRTNVVMTSDANCTLTTATNCTLTTAVGNTIGAAYTGSLNITSSVSLTAMRDVIAPLGPGKDYRACNLTSGGQRIRVIGASGNGYIIYNGQCALVFTMGSNYSGIGGQLPVSTANGGLGGDFSSASGYLRFVAGVPTAVAGVPPGCGGVTCVNQYVTGVPTTTTATTQAMTATQTSVTVGDCSKLVGPGVVLLKSTIADSQNEWIPFTDCTAGTLNGLTRGGYYQSVARAQASGSNLYQLTESRSSSTTAAPYMTLLQNNYLTYSSALLPTGGIYSGNYGVLFATGGYFLTGGEYALKVGGTMGVANPVARFYNPDSNPGGQQGSICTGASGVFDLCMGMNSVLNNSSQNGGSGLAFFKISNETTPHLLIDQSGNWNWGRSKYIGSGQFYLRGSNSGHVIHTVPADVVTYTVTEPSTVGATKTVQTTTNGSGTMAWQAGAWMHSNYASLPTSAFTGGIMTMVGPVYSEPYAVTAKSLIVRQSGGSSCSVAPVLAIMDLGTSATTAYGSATSVASVTAGTADGVYSWTGSTNLIAAHFYGIAYTAGSCTTPPAIDLTLQVE